MGQARHVVLLALFFVSAGLELHWGRQSQRPAAALGQQMTSQRNPTAVVLTRSTTRLQLVRDCSGKPRGIVKRHHIWVKRLVPDYPPTRSTSTRCDEPHADDDESLGGLQPAVVLCIAFLISAATSFVEAAAATAGSLLADADADEGKALADDADEAEAAEKELLLGPPLLGGAWVDPSAPVVTPSGQECWSSDLVLAPLNARGLGPAAGELVSESAAALRSGGRWSAIAEGTGGVWRLEASDGRYVAVFKPEAEEAGATDRPMREGFDGGDGALREVAAFRLDAANGHFAGVPPTALVHEPGRGRGSLQRHVTHEASADDFGSSLFGEDSVHRIALLDLRLLNTDRHGGNLLVLPAEPAGAGKRRLVPIDHGLALPPAHALGEANFEWLFWRQAKAPLSAEAARWVRALDGERDAEMLRELGLPEAAVTTMRLTTALLQRGVAAGWSLHELGMFCQRGGWGDVPAPMEQMVASAATRSGVALQQIASRAHGDAVVAAFDALLAQHVGDVGAGPAPDEATMETAQNGMECRPGEPGGCRAAAMPLPALRLSSSARRPAVAW